MALTKFHFSLHQLFLQLHFSSIDFSSDLITREFFLFIDRSVHACRIKSHWKPLEMRIGWQSMVRAVENNEKKVGFPACRRIMRELFTRHARSSRKIFSCPCNNRKIRSLGEKWRAWLLCTRADLHRCRLILLQFNQNLYPFFMDFIFKQRYR